MSQSITPPSGHDPEYVQVRNAVYRANMFGSIAVTAGTLAIIFGLKHPALAAALVFLAFDARAAVVVEVPYTWIPWLVGMVFKMACGYAAILGFGYFGFSGIPAEWGPLYQWAAATLTAALVVTIPGLWELAQRPDRIFET